MKQLKSDLTDIRKVLHSLRCPPEMLHTFLATSSLILFALILRLVFFQGFVLGDDAQVYGLVQALLYKGIHFNYPLTDRVFLWLFHYVSQYLFGKTEWAFFLPIWLFSASLSVMGYFILKKNGYSQQLSYFGGLFIASAPFEVMLGTTVSNDLFLEWFLAASFLWMATPMRHPGVRGVGLAFLFWCAFYVKMWAAYFLPLLCIYFFFEKPRQAKLYLLGYFIASSILLHACTMLGWNYSLGTFVPFLKRIPGNYPILAKDLFWTWKIYPIMIFSGSEFHTTLFGWIPYLYGGGILLKGLLAYDKKSSCRWDFLDYGLFLYFWIFFLCLNFISTSFHFDQYYSPARIFRYLAPISFPLMLHTIKLILDVLKAYVDTEQLPIKGLFCVALVIGNIYQASQATKPGRTYRSALFKSLSAIHDLKPPRVVAESWLGFFLAGPYYHAMGSPKTITITQEVYAAKDYETWLRRTQNNWEPGTVLITGLGSYVHYGCHGCGFRLNDFAAGLDPQWALSLETNSLSYLPKPEPARVWVFHPLFLNAKTDTHQNL